MRSLETIRRQEIRAVSLDAAGTLIEPYPSVGMLYSEVAAEWGLGRWEPSVLEVRFRSTWSNRGDFDFSRTSWIRLVNEVWSGLVSEPVPEAFFATLWSRFEEPSAWRIYPDVIPCLEALRTDGWPIVVVSNWDERLHKVLTGLGLSPWVDEVLPSVEAPAPKPDPRIFQIASQRLGISPDQLLHVGDSETEDLGGIQRAGGQGILLNRRDTASRSDTLPSLAPLPDFLRNR